MKVVKLLSIFSLICCCVGLVASEVKDSSWPKRKLVLSEGYQVFGSSLRKPFYVPVTSWVRPEAQFLYDLYAQAQGQEAVFVDLIQNNEKAIPVDECIQILKQNDEFLSSKGNEIDKQFYSSLNLRQGLLAGAKTFGGLFGMYKTTGALQAMYSRQRVDQQAITDTALAKVLQLEGSGSSFLRPKKEGDEEAYLEYKKRLEGVDTSEGVFVASGRSPSDLSSYFPGYMGAHALSIMLFSGGIDNLSEYVMSTYRLYQQKKLNRERLAKDKEIGQKMLQILEKVVAAE